MAEAMTYDSLVQDVKDYAERTDSPFVAQIPRLIMLAENRLASEAKGLGFLKVASFNLTSGNASYEKPARWRETKNFSIVVSGARRFLKPRGYEYCKMYSSDAGANGAPEFYADYDYEHFFVSKTPDTTYSAELSYYERPLPLDDDNQTNWTTQYFPQLILFATLLEAQPFLKRADRIQEFQMMYDRAIAALTGEEVRKTTDNRVVRSKE